jgi:hypothetical protein
MESRTFTCPAKRSNTGMTRRNSSDSLTGTARGRVDSPPISMISAPSSMSWNVWSSAAEGSRNCPPSENESGVTLTMPMTKAGRGKRNCSGPALRIMAAGSEETLKYPNTHVSKYPSVS